MYNLKLFFYLWNGFIKTNKVRRRVSKASGLINSRLKSLIIAEGKVQS